MTRSELDEIIASIKAMKEAKVSLAKIQVLVDDMSDSLTLAKLKTFLTSVKEILGTSDEDSASDETTT